MCGLAKSHCNYSECFINNKTIMWIQTQNWMIRGMALLLLLCICHLHPRPSSKCSVHRCTINATQPKCYKLSLFYARCNNILCHYWHSVYLQCFYQFFCCNIHASDLMSQSKYSSRRWEGVRGCSPINVRCVQMARLLLSNNS